MAAVNKPLLSAWRICGIYNYVGLSRSYSKHYNPKFRALRRKKFEAGRFNINLPKEEKEIYIKKIAGLKPYMYTNDVPYYISSTYEIFDPYVPQSGDGKFSSILAKVSGSLKNTTKDYSKNVLHSRRIKNYDQDFSMKEFAYKAKEIYIKAHEALVSKDLNEILKYTTEKAFNLMTGNFSDKTIRWKYIESLDPPLTVQVRSGQLAAKDNIFGQVTVRFHSKQMLAVYDRFGRLMYGSEILAKDVLEYIVFEKHLPNVYGTWKLHDKIIPDWLPPSDPIPKTYCHVPEEDRKQVVDKELRLRTDILPESEDAYETQKE